MDKINEFLQEKFLTYDDNGENASFDDVFLEKDEMSIHSDLTELFETGFYYTNNKECIDKIVKVLERINVFYKIENAGLWKYKLII